MPLTPRDDEQLRYELGPLLKGTEVMAAWPVGDVTFEVRGTGASNSKTRRTLALAAWLSLLVIWGAALGAKRSSAVR
jgi:hypothetical protein